MSNSSQNQFQVTCHVSKPGSMDCNLMAELKAAYEPEDLDVFKRLFEYFCDNFKARNNFKPRTSYEFVMVNSTRAEVWKLDSKGDRVGLLVSISKIRQEAAV